MTRHRLLAVSICALLAVTGCAGTDSDSPAGSTPTGIFQTGLASWYGEEFHGRQTASGETFDMYQLTAAHRTLAFGTMVEVENLANGRRVKVRINDRGPTPEDRIIDLSKAAAGEIGMVAQGVAEVTLRLAGGK